LVTEDDDAALGNEQSELVFLGVGETGELKAADLGADERGQLCLNDCVGVLWEEVGFRLVSGQATVLELERL
jgi:hypothetical protein